MKPKIFQYHLKFQVIHAGSCYVRITGGVNIVIRVSQSIGRCVFVCVSDIKLHWQSKNHVIFVNPSVNWMSCYINHTTSCCWY